MSAVIIDGKKVSAECNECTRLRVAELKQKYGITPGLAVVLVGDDPASQIYVNSKFKKSTELGLRSEKIILPKETSESNLLDVIDRLNKNKSIHGILVQSPTPKQINEENIVLAIDPNKDVDCFHPFNAGRLFLGDTTGFMPCTPFGVMQMLKAYNITTSGKTAVVLGRSNIVGKPMQVLLSNKGADATVTLCHSHTPELKKICAGADILVAAIGKPEFVTGDMIKPGAIVIDVGINRIPDPSKVSGTRLVGDVKFSEAVEIASAITPVPGGVGPMTIAMLMRNAVRACEISLGL